MPTTGFTTITTNVKVNTIPIASTGTNVAFLFVNAITAEIIKIAVALYIFALCKGMCEHNNKNLMH